MSEVIKIRQRYDSRKIDKRVQKHYKHFHSYYFIRVERELRFNEILKRKFSEISRLKIIEIGAGNGHNLIFFHRLGIPWKNIWANELLEDRGEELIHNLHPGSHICIGNALDLDFRQQFDIVLQSTVFTSILDNDFKRQLAKKTFEMIKSGGIVLWYDFKYNNPHNKDVKGISKKEIKQLFPNAKNIEFYNVTLAPPIGRKLGKLYNLINFLFPFLRTHLIAVVKK